MGQKISIVCLSLHIAPLKWVVGGKNDCLLVLIRGSWSVGCCMLAEEVVECVLQAGVVVVENMFFLAPDILLGYL